MAYYKNTKQYKKQQHKKNQTENRSVNAADVTLIQTQKYFDSKLENLDKLEAKGAAIHSVVNRRTSSSFLSDVKDYTDPRIEDRENVVPLARKLRTVEGICGSVADLLADFGIAQGHFVCDNPELEALLNRWAEFINSPNNLGVGKKAAIYPIAGLRAALRKIFDDYITDGDSVFTLFWEKNVKMDPTIDAQGYFLPTTIRILDSLMLTIDEDLAKLGIEQIELNIDDRLKKKLKDPQTEAEKQLVKMVPKEWIKAIKENKPITLDPNVTYHIKRNGKDYKPWGESLFVRAFNAIAAKRRLQAVDEATIDGLINRLTIFSLGLEDETKNKIYHRPSPARVEALINLLTNQKRVNAIVWPGPDLKVEDFGPDGKILEFTEKYAQADKDILRALHVSPLLIDGGSSGQSVRDWAAFLSTEVGLDAVREDFERVLSSIAREIALTNKMTYTRLYYKFETQLLKDENKIRTLAMKLYELGGISIKTLLTSLGYDFENEKFLKEKERDEGLEEIFVNRTLPYQGGTVAPDGRPTGTTNEDKGKPSAPGKAPQADTQASVRTYFQLFLDSFNKIRKDMIMLQPAADRQNSSRELELALVSGFSEFKKLVEMELKNYFMKSVGNSTKFNKEFNKLITWNNQYIDNFYAQLRDQLVSSYEDYDMFISHLDKVTYRIYQYADECFTKATWFGRILQAKKDGVTQCVWRAHEGANCELAQNRNNSIHLIDSMLEEFPPHPGCKCFLEFIK